MARLLDRLTDVACATQWFDQAGGAGSIESRPSAVIDRRYSFATVTWVLTELAMKQFS